MDELDKKIQSVFKKAKKRHSPKEKSECLEDSMLSSYIDDALIDAEKQKVENHLTECGDCLALVILNSKVRAGEAHEILPEVPQSLVKKAMELVAPKAKGEGLFDIVFKFARETIEIIANPANLGISQMPAPVSVRGKESATADNLITVNKTFKDISCDIEIIRSAQESVNFRAMVKETGSGDPIEGIRLNLLNPDREIASSMTQAGIVQFDDLKFGKYVLKIVQKGNEIGQVSLDIQG